MSIAYGFFLLLLCVVPVYAAESPTEGVQVSPLRVDWKMEDGAAKSEKISLHNYSDVPQGVEISVEDFYVSDDGIKPQFFVPDEKHPLKAYDVIDWIDVPEGFTMAPGESREVEFHVQIPEGQPTNSYYGSIFFKTRTDDADVNDADGGSAKIKVHYRVGTLVLLQVQGDEPMRIAGQLEEFSVAKKVFWDKPIELTTRVKSTANVHYQVDGEITITKFDKKFATVEMKSENLYPERIRLFTDKIDFGMWDFGMYKATLTMRSEEGTVQITGETEPFFVIPWKSSAMIGGVIVLVIAIRIFIKKFVIIDWKKSKRK